MTRPSSALKPQTRSKVPKAGQSTESISALHVDDDEAFLELSQLYLKKMMGQSLQMDSISDPEQVFEKLKTKIYDVIICDYEMPKINGIQLLKNFKDQNITIPVIMLTGKSREEIAIQALNLDAKRYIKKGSDAHSQYRELVHAITEVVHHERTEQALKTSEERNRRLIESSDDMIFSVDRSGVFKTAGGKRLTDFGLTPKAVINNSLENLFGLAEAQRYQELHQQVFKSGQSLTYEHQLEFAGVSKTDLTTIYPIRNKKGQIEEVGVICRDVTQIKNAEHELRVSETNFRVVTESSPGLILIYQDYQCVYANPTATEITGYSLAEISTMKFWDLLHPDYADLAINSGKTIEKTGTVPLKNALIRIVTKDRQERWLDARLTMATYNGKQAAIIFALDITDYKQAEEEQRKQREELSQFAHVMAHDLNNSLQIIEGYTQLLKEKYDQSYLQLILKQSNYLKKLLKRSLTLAEAGLTVDKQEKIELTTLVKDIAQLTIPSEITFLCDDLPEIHGDREKLAQIFKNLFENAVIHGQPTKIEVKHEVSDTERAIIVMNNGTPIPPTIKDNLFERGVTTKPGSPGLGLAIVKKLVEAHKWNIRLRPSLTSVIFQITYR
ncbi:MAG: PAS domain S-box protein [Candidatus Hodarchaeota archaeon]